MMVRSVLEKRLLQVWPTRDEILHQHLDSCGCCLSTVWVAQCVNAASVLAAFRFGVVGGQYGAAFGQFCRAVPVCSLGRPLVFLGVDVGGLGAVCG